MAFSVFEQDGRESPRISGKLLLGVHAVHPRGDRSVSGCPVAGPATTVGNGDNHHDFAHLALEHVEREPPHEIAPRAVEVLRPRAG